MGERVERLLDWYFISAVLADVRKHVATCAEHGMHNRNDSGSDQTVPEPKRLLLDVEVQ